MYKILTQDIIHYTLVFCRISVALALVPGFSQTTIPNKVRILLGIVLTLILTPAVTPTLPLLADFNYQALAALFHELLVGMLIGTCLSILMFTLDLAGDLISQQTGHSNAVLFNPILGHQSNISSTLLTLAGITLLFITDLDHLILKALVDSYYKFPHFDLNWAGDWLQVILRYIQDGFIIAIKIAAPLLVCITIFFVGLGLLNRLLPIVQIFFISQPVQIGLGLLLFALTIAPGLVIFTGFVQQHLSQFIR